MAGSATVYVERGVLGHTLAYTAMPAPAAIYIGLCQADLPPTAATGGTEAAGNGYVRMLATFALTADPDETIAANTATIEWPAATAAWGTLGFFELWDAVTAGQRLYWGPLVDPVDGITPITRAVMGGDIVRLTAGTVQVQAI